MVQKYILQIVCKEESKTAKKQYKLKRINTDSHTTITHIIAIFVNKDVSFCMGHIGKGMKSSAIH